MEKTMSKRHHNLALAALLLATACGDEEEPQHTDASVPDDVEDGGIEGDDGGPARPDAGHNADGGVTDTDGGADAPQDDGGDGRPDARAAFYLSTGDEAHNLSPATIVLDAQDNAHMVYPAYAGGGAYYAFCEAGSCDRSEDLQVVRFETDGTTANAMIALTEDGHPRVLLSAYYGVYFARCDARCGEAGSWSIDVIHDHRAEKEVTGQAFALDPNGHPRFLIHTTRALFGIGQDAPQTELFRCDADDCTKAASWSASQISTDIFYRSTLRYGTDGTAHIATALASYEGTSPKDLQLAYGTCSGTCAGASDVKMLTLIAPYERMYSAVAEKATIDLELGKDGRPRLALIGAVSDPNEKAFVYGECPTGDCTEDPSWSFVLIERDANLSQGIDLVLDAADHPHIAYTYAYNILSATCEKDCTVEGMPWDADMLFQRTADLPTDDIFLFPGCNAGAWLFSQPSLAIAKSGALRATYEARDISGHSGPVDPDPTKPQCTAGTDMVLGRVVLY